MKFRIDYLNVVTLLLVMFVAYLGAAIAQSQEVESELPLYRAALEVSPRHIVEGADIHFIFRGILPDGTYGLIAPDKPQIQTDEEFGVTRLILPFKVLKVSDVGIQALIDVEEKVTVSGLTEGRYEAIATVNGEIVNQQKFSVLAEGAKIPIDYSEINANVVMSPPNPMPDDEVTFYMTGEFLSAGFTIIEKRLDVMESLPEQVAARLYVEEPTEPAAQVITPFRVEVGKAKLSAGVHPLIGTINEQVVYEGAFDVGDIRPEPQPEIADVEIVIEPSNLEAGEEFSVYAKGVFPSPGYFIAEKSFYLTRSLPAHIVVNLTVLPLEGIQPHEEQAFKEFIGTAALPEGAHPVLGFMNDVLFYKSKLVVRDKQSSRVPVYKFGLEVVPPNPAPGGSFDVYAVGIFPTPGYIITHKEIAIGESFPETILASLEIEAPSGIQPEVEEPFRKFVGSAFLDAGEHPILGSVNGEILYRSILNVGEAPPNPEWITFQRSGGFTGWVQHLYVNQDRTASITSDAVVVEGNRSGLVPLDNYERLRDLVNRLDFTSLDSYYPNKVPIADGFVYEITVERGHSVLIEQESAAPVELQDLVSVLESILDGRIDLDRKFDAETSVNHWSLY